jgi:hypothetical protein
MIKLGNLSASLRIWLMSTLQLGPGIGDVFHLVVSGSAYHTWLLNQRIAGDHIFTTLAAAYAAMTNRRNDVLLVYPGTYVVTASLTWANDFCHMIGLGGPNQRGYDTYGTQFYSTTITVAQIINLTGKRCQFHNVTFANNGANAACLSAFKVDGYGAFLKNIQAIGMMAATQCDTTLANSLDIAAGASYLRAEDCIFGTTEWAVQGSNTNAPILFSNTNGATMPQDGKFTNCKIQSQIAAATRPLIHVGNHAGVGRDWIFDRCEFYAFSDNHAVACAQVITDPGNPMTHDILFKDCHAFNVTAYRTASDGCTWASGGGAAAAKTGVAVVTT